MRQVIEALTNHANKHKVTQISMPKASCGLDRLESHKMERLIKEIYGQSSLAITLRDQNKTEHSQKQTEALVRSALDQLQRQDEALSKLIEWVESGKVPTSQDLQGLPRHSTPLWNFVPKIRNSR